MDKRGTYVKQPLESSPFVVEFEYGVTAHIRLHGLAIRRLHQHGQGSFVSRLHYDYVFLFDHSCGHDRKRPDAGLCANSIRMGFGEKQAEMRDKTLLLVISFLSLH
jgi:hypothetical protein